MAKRDKDKLYYEITREKPYGVFQMLMVGGSAGAVLSFLIVSLVGAYVGMEMDALILAFLAASFLGFFFGAVLTWLFIHYFEKWIPFSPLLGGRQVQSTPTDLAEVPVEPEASPVVEDEETKGKSVDFVFPELSPDKQ